ncbi:MAG: tRNA pseudouridine(38-40) synthase TruA [Arenimonas sp.]
MRYALGIEYDGSAYSGWQRLSEETTVQAVVEGALSFVAHHAVQVVCSGRTDAGVHAYCQVIHFDSDAERTDRAWVLGTNTKLPRDVRVLWCQPMPDEFHARYSARARRYRYTILNRSIPPAMQRHFLSWERLSLNVDAMHEAAQALVGMNDFTTFRTVKCQAKHPNRDLHDISVTRQGEQVIIEVQANGFLHHMVRNIVGSLIVIGHGEKHIGWMAELLALKDRTQAGPTAPAEGLVFLSAKYPQEWSLPIEVTL